MWTDLEAVLQGDEKQIDAFFGSASDRMETLVVRARELFPSRRIIVWQGDPQTFAFQFVGGDAERILGYPAGRWTDDLSFWSEVVVHPDDRDDAVAFCALATAKQRDHAFEYRARAADGSEVWLLDVVRVIQSARGVAGELRGLMFDVSEAKAQDQVSTDALRVPTQTALADA